MTGLSIKPGVELLGLSPQATIALMAAVGAYADIAGAPVVLTSACDGQHSSASLHYVGHAVDLRTRDLAEGQADEIAVALGSRLGPQFDVVNEADHIHIEWQPKRSS